MAPLQFAPWRSDIDFSFYSSLASRKIDYDKLDDAARKLVGRYEIQPSDDPERSVRMQILGDALTADKVSPPRFRAEGTIKNTNTIEEFRALDRTAIMEQSGRTIWDAILDGTIYSCPSLLSSFFAIFFADLKKYRFTYHFAFPALHYEEKWQSLDDIGNKTRSRLPASESWLLYDAVSTWRTTEQDSRQHGFFLAKRLRRGQMNNEPPSVTDSTEGASDLRPETPKTPKADDMGFRWQVGPLSSYERGFFDNIEPEDRFVCFVDPSTYESNPGWMLRNLLILIRARWGLKSTQVLCYRDTQHRREQANSLLLRLHIPEVTQLPHPAPKPKLTGWERTDTNKIASRTVDLSRSMKPESLADQSVDLNLKLMKWRIAPNLDLDVIRNTKCLLLGAGTLGSYVSRNLLGWGVRKITFVDNGKVSFSNPVRQPLFTFEDCKNGGAEKATCAAKALQSIYPGVDAQGHVMPVPMAGHPMIDEARTKEEFDKLKKLIDEHDAIFLLMDSRESRWLPTVMGKAAGKIVLNAALGFDSYVVMRHGAKARSDSQGQELGCYFCNDVVAPADSQKDATLDQQCTVTRPGIAPLASATLVELLVSILQHPLSHHAPAATSNPNSSTSNTTTSTSAETSSSADMSSQPHDSSPSARDPNNHPLGLLPHTLRHYLSTFSTLLIHGQAYDSCSACSPRMLALYEQQGWEFVRRAVAERGYVEEVSGLAEVQRHAEEASRRMEEVEDDDEFGGEIYGEGELL